MKEELIQALRIKAAEGNDFAVARLKELEKPVAVKESLTTASEPKSIHDEAVVHTKPENVNTTEPKLAPTPKVGTENGLNSDKAVGDDLTPSEEFKKKYDL